jgi:hypothetical protein
VAAVVPDQVLDEANGTVHSDLAEHDQADGEAGERVDAVSWLTLADPLQLADIGEMSGQTGSPGPPMARQNLNGLSFRAASVTRQRAAAMIAALARRARRVARPWSKCLKTSPCTFTLTEADVSTRRFSVPFQGRPIERVVTRAQLFTYCPIRWNGIKPRQSHQDRIEVKRYRCPRGVHG